jgi:hypothetical protein
MWSQRTPYLSKFSTAPHKLAGGGLTTFRESCHPRTSRMRIAPGTSESGVLGVFWVSARGGEGNMPPPPRSHPSSWFGCPSELPSDGDHDTSAATPQDLGTRRHRAAHPGIGPRTARSGHGRLRDGPGVSAMRSARHSASRRCVYPRRRSTTSDRCWAGKSRRAGE